MWSQNKLGLEFSERINCCYVVSPPPTEKKKGRERDHAYKWRDFQENLVYSIYTEQYTDLHSIIKSQLINTFPFLTIARYCA